MLRRFDDLRAAVLPMPSRPQLPPSALSGNTVVATNSLCFGTLSAPASAYQTLSHANAHAPLIVALPPRQQSFAWQPAPDLSTIVAPAALQSIQPLSQFVSVARRQSRRQLQCSQHLRLWRSFRRKH